MASAASGQCRHLLLQPRDIIFSWGKVMTSGWQGRLGGILPFWNGSAPMCVFSPSLSPTKTSS